MGTLQFSVMNQLNESSLASGLTLDDIEFEAATEDPILLSGFTEENKAIRTSRKLRDDVTAQGLRDLHFADIVCLFCDDQAFKKGSASGHGFNNANANEAFVCARVSKVKEDYEKCCQAKQLLGLTPGDTQKLEILQEEIELLNEVWRYLHKVWEPYESTKDTLIAAITNTKIKQIEMEATAVLNKIPAKLKST